MTDTDQSQTHTPRWVKITLTASLCLNLLVAGAFIGANSFDHDGPRRDASSRGSVGGPLARALPNENRQALRASLLGGGQDLRSQREEMRTLRAQTLIALRVQPFDAEAFEMLLAQQTAIGSTVATVGQAALLEQIVQMSDEERATYADRLEKMARRGGKRK